MRNWRKHWWIATATAVVVVYALVGALTPFPGHAYALSVFADAVSFSLLSFLCFVLLRNAARSHGKTRQFWGAMWLGAMFWLVGQILWMWFQLELKRAIPHPFLGFLLMFTHLVPMMGAIAIGAHRAKTHRRLDAESMDVAILLLWWIYAYAFVVLPWQYVVPNLMRGVSAFSLLYSIENVVLVLGLFILLFRARGEWRRVYFHFFLAAACYAAFSQSMGSAIAQRRYYSGSLYDIPLIVSMCLFIFMALSFNPNREQLVQERGPRRESGIVSLLAMCSVLSLPVVAAWGTLFSLVPQPVASFRLAITAYALIVLPSCVFLKQHLLGRELVQLLGASQRNVGNLKKLQTQLVQSEKLASIGEVLAGAAHQISNPLTAVIGYSDLLQQDFHGNEEHAAWISKIGQQARRTQDLLKQLLTFAKQDPAQKQLTDLNRVVADAIELHELDLDKKSIRIVQQLSNKLPHLWADGNQLLQVCFHIIGNAIDAMKPKGGGVLTVRTRVEGGNAVVEFSDTGVGIAQPQRIFDPFYTTKPVGQGTGLGLSACYGIVAEHGGTIISQNRPDGGATFIVSLPVTYTPAATEVVAAPYR
jgi:signal transduction histidine kinase